MLEAVSIDSVLAGFEFFLSQGASLDDDEDDVEDFGSRFTLANSLLDFCSRSWCWWWLPCFSLFSFLSLLLLRLCFSFSLSLCLSLLSLFSLFFSSLSLSNLFCFSLSLCLSLSFLLARSSSVSLSLFLSLSRYLSELCLSFLISSNWNFQQFSFKECPNKFSIL